METMARPRLGESERRALGQRVRMAAELRLGAAELRELNRIGVQYYRTLSNEIQNHWLISASLQIGPQRSRARSGEANPCRRGPGRDRPPLLSVGRGRMGGLKYRGDR